MADDQVKYSELVRNDNNNFQGLIDALNTVKAKINELREEGTRIRVSINGVSSATRDQQQALGQDAASAERLRNDLRQLTDEEARLKAAIAEANRMTKLQAQAEQAAAGSLNEMRAKYKLLVAEMGRYNLKTEEGRRKMQTTAAQARKLRDEIYKLEASYGQFGRNVGNYTGALSRFSARLKEAAARFVAFNAAFLSFTGMIRFGKELFNVRKELESTLVIYKSLVGEVQGAKIFEEVKNFALTTPVTLNAASKAVQTMLGFGVAADKAVDIMKRLGDISGADAERMERLALAYAQATQAGRLMGQDTLQFINAGFNPLFYISLRTGESMESLRDQMKKGKIDINQVTQAIIDATSEGGQFNGMLEKQKETMKGAAAIMEGAWQNMLNEMGQDMESGIVGIIKWLTNLMKNWRETMNTLEELAVGFGTAKAVLWLWKAALDAGTASLGQHTAALNADTAANAANTVAAEKATMAGFSLKGMFKSVGTAVKGLGSIAVTALKRFIPFAVLFYGGKLVMGLVNASRETKRLTDYTKDFAATAVTMNKETADEVKLLDKLFEELKKAKKGSKEYRDAQQNIIDNFSQYDSKLKTELTDVNNLGIAYDNLKTAIENAGKARARQAFQQKAEERLNEAAAGLTGWIEDFMSNADYVDELGRFTPKALTREYHSVPSMSRTIARATEYTTPSPVDWFNAAQQLLAARSMEELQGNMWYDAIVNGHVQGVPGAWKDWVGVNKDERIVKYIESLKKYIESTRKANGMWGEYKPLDGSGYPIVFTGGDVDDGKNKKPSGGFNNSYRGVMMEDVLVEEANAMRDKGGDVLAEIQLWYNKKVAIANAAYDKEMATLKKETKQREDSLTENLNKAIIFQSKYSKLVAEVDKDPTLDEEGKAARKAELERQLNEATALIADAENQRQNITDYYAAKAIAARQKRDNELADLDEQRTEKTIAEEEKRFKAQQEIAKRQFELTKHTSKEEKKFVMEQQMEFLQWRIDHAEALGISPELLEVMKAEYAQMKKMYDLGKYSTGKQNIKGNYTSISDLLWPDLDSDQTSALNSVFDQAKEALNSWMDARQKAADQAKKLADDEVSAAENALNREIELRNQGYANNVALRERELADAKKRQQEAAKLQQKAKKEELAVNTAMEASSMAVAVANLFKQFPLYVAIPLTGVLLGAWASAKVSALNSIKSTKYREGGVMLLEGGSHQSGHDVNLGIGPDGSNLRAEGGEYFAVINKRNSRRYGSEIPNIVNALNSGMFEDRYIKTSDAMGMLPRIIKADDGSTVDLSAVESGVGALVKQGERTSWVEGNYRYERYKNLTRKIRVS